MPESEKPWQVVVSASAAKDLTKHPERRAQFAERLQALSAGPGAGGSKMLHGRPEWSLRVGGFRVLYQVDEPKCTIVITAVGSRGDIYKKP